MGELDLIVDALGTTVALQAPGPLLDELRAAFADLASSGAPDRELTVEESPDGTFRLLDDGIEVLGGVAPAVTAATVLWHLNAITAASTPSVLVHAGCVGDESAVLVPGRSGAGKSTIVADCVAAGLGYLSDEYAVVDRDRGVIVPYPKPIALDNGVLVAASALRGGSVRGALAPAGIVFPRYEAAAAPAVAPLDPGWTLVALVAHTTNFSRLRATALPWLAGLALSCPAWQVTYADTTDAVPTIAEAARAPGEPIRPTHTITPVTPSTTTVELGDELAVLSEVTGQVHLLNPAMAHVWRCVPDAVGRDRLADLAIDRAPTGALDAPTAAAAIGHLTDSGLLTAAWT